MKSRFALAAAALASLCVLGAGMLWTAQQDTPPNKAIDVYLGETRLSIPVGYFRFEHAKLGGRLPEIDLAADASTFLPVKKPTKTPLKPPDTTKTTIYLTLTRASGNLSPGERTTRLYVRFLEADAWNHPGGLILRRFADSSPYRNEDLYLAPPEGRKFSARCPRPRQAPDGLPDTCLAELRMQGIDIRLRFSSSQLPEWEKLYNGTRGLIQSFRR